MDKNPYLNHLHENQWEIIRYVNGKGIEISENDFNVLPKAIKIVSEDDPVKYHSLMRFISKDFIHLPEVPDDSLDYIFVTEFEPGKLISEESIQSWQKKLHLNGYLILHSGTTGFEVSQNGTIIDYLPEKKERSCCIIRYGAFGDCLQTSSILPELKRQGYHITVISTNPGANCIAHDPNIDELVIQDREVVRNVALGQYWQWLAKRYDKFVNLSESVEGTFLPDHNRMAFHWPYQVRHKHMNYNYVQHMHELAGLVYERPSTKFYPTAEELVWADEELAKMRKRSKCKKTIVWALAGSSLHKVYPWLDTFVAKVMLEIPDTEVVLVGGPETFQLQAGWQEEPRVHLEAGQWSIRQTLTFIQKHADLLIGPETGVMNGMSMEPMPKIVFLSHSTFENLTRDWVNTCSLHADYQDMQKLCQNCCLHRLHQVDNGWQYCTRGPETGAALCQESIDVSQVFNVSQKALKTGFVK